MEECKENSLAEEKYYGEFQNTATKKVVPSML
jgi:hypothetical protein